MGNRINKLPWITLEKEVIGKKDERKVGGLNVEDVERRGLQKRHVEEEET